MSRPVRVSHPVLHRFVPRRGTRLQHGFGTGRTDVAIRGFAESPRPVAVVEGTTILSAEGRAWEPAASVPGGPQADEAELRGILEAGGRHDHAGRTALSDYLFRSPVSYSRVGAFHVARGASTGRGGDVRPEAVRILAEDGGERAAADVRGFLDGRIRLHEGKVYLRYERVVLRWNDHLGVSHSYLPRHPRAELLGGEAAFPGADGSPVPAVAEHGRIPSELLGDDDAGWFANAYAHRLASRLGVLSLPAREGDPDAVPRARFVSLADGIAELERRAWTGSLTGERLLPALRLVAQALEDLRDIDDARADSRPPHPLCPDIDRSDADRSRRALAVLRGSLIPRIIAADPVVPEDAETLSALAR